MLLILRKMKRSYLDNSDFRKYLFYALGEMVLIVIGILIALQIDNWNTATKEQETLWSYLRSIARNIDSDLLAVNDVRAKREETYEASARTAGFIVEKTSYDVAEIMFAYNALARSQELLFFDPNTSGYDALKSSGNLDEMQGTDIERLLYDYYETVSRITHAEQSHNEYVRMLSLQVINHWPKEMAEWEFILPRSLAADRFQALQSSYQELLNNINTISLYRRARSIEGLLSDYEELNRLGSAYIQLVEFGMMNFDDTIHGILDGKYVPSSGLGYPNVITDGQVAWHSYGFLAPSSTNYRIAGRSVEKPGGDGQREAFYFDSFEQSDNSLHIAYPGGADWAAISIHVQGSSTTRPSLDFSGFDKLVLEVKGDLGGETILVHLKDKDDPDDGSQTNIELQLSDQWQTFEIDLADFQNADTSSLHLVLGFLFFEEAQSFSVRNATYVKSR